MAIYFPGFHDALDLAEADAQPLAKPSDAGGDALPFAHLEDRRFEVLVYRLKDAEMRPRGHRVTLMQGVGRRSGPEPSSPTTRS